MSDQIGSKAFSVLIVDDIPKNIQVAANILQDYNLFFAQDGESALQQVKKNHFDLILLDVMMPGMNGFDVCAALKRDEDLRIRNIPVVFLTARSDMDDIVKGFEVGGVDYVTKPFNGAELSARVKTHLTLKDANRKLLELNAAKDKFFSIVAHDLRNPLQVLILCSEILAESYHQFDEDTRIDYIGKMCQNSAHLADFLENLLQWAGSQQGAITFLPTKIDLCFLTDETIKLLKAGALEKTISLTSSLSKDLNVFADANMIKTVIRNLISNAVKFTPSGGGIDVFAEVTQQQICLSVRDSGIGMNPKELERLFRVDAKISKPGTNNEKGTGLGLILCKEFIRRNKGTICVASTPGAGSCFTICLPIYREVPET